MFHFAATRDMMPGEFFAISRSLTRERRRHVDAHQHVTRSLPAQADCNALVERILQSGPFHRSPRQRELLRFIASEQAAGRAAEISEQHIGRHVFGRPHGYNQAEDNIVRVAARQLRVRLRQYFEAEGSGERLVVEIPKGGYRLEFRLQDRVPEQLSKRAAAPSKWRNWTDAMSRPASAFRALGLGLACLLAGYLLGGSRGPGGTPRKVSAAAPAPPAIDELLPGPHPVNVVVADTTLIMLQALQGRVSNIQDYARHSYLLAPASDQSAGSIPDLIGKTRLTSLADVSFIATILRDDGPLRNRVQIRHARNASSRDFLYDDAVILGGPRVNPWVELFEPQLNFQFRFNNVGPGCFLNQSPKQGEQPQYGDCRLDDSGDYARVAWVPNGSRTGHVLLISGNSAPATESASDFLLAPGSAARLLALLRGKDFAHVESFELLLHVPHPAGTSLHARLIAMRTHRAQPL
jgi:hypothetical protein